MREILDIQKKIRNDSVDNRVLQEHVEEFPSEANWSVQCRIRSIYLRWPQLYSIKISHEKTKTLKDYTKTFSLPWSPSSLWWAMAQDRREFINRQAISYKKCNSGDHHQGCITNYFCTCRWWQESMENRSSIAANAQKKWLYCLFFNSRKNW